MNPPPKEPQGTPREWLAYAESDLKLAGVAKERRDILPELACFHAQQAAEKALKAVLLSKQIEFPFSHDLKALVGLLEKNDIPFPPEIREAVLLSSYAAEARYPGPIDEITPSEVDEALRIAESVLTWAAGII